MALSSTKNNIFKKVKDYVQKQDGLYPVSRDTSSDTVFMGNSNASNVNTLTTVVGDGNYTSGDNGEMAEGLYSDSLIPKITDNESFTSAMPKLTRIVNNVRYLVHALGTSDITQIGDGTLTGAISTLNSNLSKALFSKQFAVKNGLTLDPGQRISYAYDKNTFDVQGYVRLSFFTFSSGQNFVSIDVAFVDNNVYFTIINNHQSSSLTFDVYCLIVYGKKEIVNIAN